MIETGIKALDLFAPVVRGGTVGFVARPNMGQFVLLAEFMHRMKKRGFATIFWDPGVHSPGISDVVKQAEYTFTTQDELYKQIVALRDEHDVLLAADRTTVLSGELLALRDRLKEVGARPITIALVDATCEAADAEAPYGPLDTLWRFDTDLISRQLYPAINPISSTSTILEGAHLEAVHLTTQQKARKILRRYRELRSIVAAHGVEKMPEDDLRLYKRGERLEAYLAQPFFVAEAFTNLPGEWLPLYDTLEDVRRILDGGADQVEPAELSYKGRLELSQ